MLVSHCLIIRPATPRQQEQQQQPFVIMPNGITATTSAPGVEQSCATRLTILPLLILPLEVSSDQAAAASAASLVGEVISHLRNNLTVLTPLVSTTSYNNSYASANGTVAQFNSLPYGIRSEESDISNSVD